MKTVKKSFVFIPLLITVLLIIIGISVLIAGQPSKIKIYTSSDFTRFLEKDAGEASKKAVLYADIVLKNSFEPAELACKFDGNGHTINVKDNGVPCLFASITETGSVKNLALTGKEGETAAKVTAGITLQNLGTIENCVVSADFSGGGFVSGICHTNNGIITNCFVRSYETGDKDLRYIWNPICAENYGSVKDTYYSDASAGEYKTAGEFISQEEINSGNPVGTLNEYTESKSGLIGWLADEKGYPCFKSNAGSEAASVFSGGIGVFLACIIILIIAVPIFTIVYVDKQKKKVFFNKQ